MSLPRTLIRTLGVLAIGMSTQASALASPSSSTAPQVSSQPSRSGARAGHASLRLDVGRGKVWVGQAVPVTLTALFRSVDGVTLEGAPQLTSQGVFTSQLSSEPRQATEIIDGQPVLVATWTGSVTPSSPGPLDVVASMPVRVRYREAAAQVTMPDVFQDDPFGAFGGNPFDTKSVQRFFEQSMGQTRDESVALRASTRPIDVEDLPAAGQPVTFSGAVGHFDLKAGLSAAQAHVSEPITLRVVVTGAGDLDRVDLPGVASSNEWKTYPPKATVEPAVPGKRLARKVFEQVLVPLQPGPAQVPPVALTFFDPSTSRYATRTTSPLPVPVDGVASPAEPPAASDVVPAPMASAPAQVAPLQRVVSVTPSKVALRIAPVVLLALLAALAVILGRKRTKGALRRSMRHAATRGSAVPFYRAAHALIEERLAERWGILREEVSPDVIRARLGDDGEPLAEALRADAALRFGRAQLEAPELVALCTSIERSLGGVS